MFSLSTSRTARTSLGRASRKTRPSRFTATEALESRTLLTVVLPGASVAVTGTTAAARPELAGTVIRDALLPFVVTAPSGAEIFKGTLQDRVVRETKTGTLDFYETIRASTSTPTAALDNVIRATFSGFSTDVDYRTDGLGNPAIHPGKVDRSAPPGGALRFDFGGVGIGAGQLSRFYFIKTNAVAFDVSGLTAIVMRAPSTNVAQFVKLKTAEPIQATQRTGSISGIKFNDLNGDGQHEPTEPALARWTIFLDANNDGKLDNGERATTTDALGHYTFANLTPGTYRVGEVLQPGWRQTAPATKFYTVTVKPGSALGGLDFGNTRLGQIGGTVSVQGSPAAGPIPLANAVVFIDANHDGVLEAGEMSAKTDSKGKYLFDNLAEGSYDVSVVPTQGFAIGAPAGGDIIVVLDSGQVRSDVNFSEMRI